MTLEEAFNRYDCDDAVPVLMEEIVRLRGEVLQLGLAKKLDDPCVLHAGRHGLKECYQLGRVEAAEDQINRLQDEIERLMDGNGMGDGEMTWKEKAESYRTELNAMCLRAARASYDLRHDK